MLGLDFALMTYLRGGGLGGWRGGGVGGGVAHRSCQAAGIRDGVCGLIWERTQVEAKREETLQQLWTIPLTILCRPECNMTTPAAQLCCSFTPKPPHPVAEMSHTSAVMHLTPKVEIPGPGGTR